MKLPLVMACSILLTLAAGQPGGGHGRGGGGRGGGGGGRRGGGGGGRAGYCPLPSVASNPVSCARDSDCSGDLKCCMMFRGATCTRPERTCTSAQDTRPQRKEPNDGFCPFPRSVATSTTCCQSDGDCAATEKCCPQVDANGAPAFRGCVPTEPLTCPTIDPKLPRSHHCMVNPTCTDDSNCEADELCCAHHCGEKRCFDGHRRDGPRRGGGPHGGRRGPPPG